MDEDEKETGIDERDRKRWDEAHDLATFIHRTFFEARIPNEPSLLERLSASMKFTEHQSWGAKWVIRLAGGLTLLWAVVQIAREVITLVQGIAG